MVESVVKLVGGVGVLLTAVAFLVRRLVDHRLAIALAQCRTDWKRQLEGELAHLKADLAKSGRVHTESIEHVRGVWTTIASYGKAVVAVGQGQPPTPALQDALAAFEAVLTHSGIFLGIECCERLRELLGPKVLDRILAADLRVRENLVKEFKEQLVPEALREVESVLSGNGRAPRYSGIGLALPARQAIAGGK